MKVENSVLTQYEKAIIRGTPDSKADILTATKRTQAIVNAMLSAKGEAVTMEDGTVVEPTIEEVLISKALSKEMESPKGLETIEKMMKIRGELDDSTVVKGQLSLVDQDLAKRAVD